jgi:hypothetical protein
VQIREGWTVAIGGLFGAAAAIVGLLLLINVAPENAPVVGTGILLAGISRLLPVSALLCYHGHGSVCRCDPCRGYGCWGLGELGKLCQECGHRALLHGEDRAPICIAWTEQQWCKCPVPRADIVRLTSRREPTQSRAEART